MRSLWAHRDIDAPAGVLWRLLTDVDTWPEWGPSVRAAELHSPRFDVGARGTVTPVTGGSLPFEITHVDDGHRWKWKVAGIPATEHVVDPLDPQRCRVGFGVPWAAAPYLAVCRLALRRLDTMAAPDRTAR